MSSVSRSIVSAPICLVPLNIRCSKRWAKPERPGGSSLPPTWWAMLIATVGVRRSSRIRTRRPLGSVRSTNARGWSSIASEDAGVRVTGGRLGPRRYRSCAGRGLVCRADGPALEDVGQGRGGRRAVDEEAVGDPAFAARIGGVVADRRYVLPGDA